MNDDRLPTSAHVTETIPTTMEAGIFPLEVSTRVRLSVMMFLQYFVWGTWWVTVLTYLGTIGFSDTQKGFAASMSAVAAMIAPFFVGLVADRYFATEKVLATLHLVGAGLLFWASTIESFQLFAGVILLYFMCYMPSMALTNSLAFHHLSSPERQFPGIRVLGTIGWIAAGLLVGFCDLERSYIPMQIGAAASVLLALYCLTLPHTPPPQAGKEAKLSTILGLDAMKLMHDRAFLVFVVGVFLILIPLQFYYAGWPNAYLNEIGVENAAGIMTIGQMSEIFFMLMMPFFFVRLGVKYMMLVGMFAWSLRYLLLAYGNAHSQLWMLYLGIGLHGVCYDFLLVTAYIYVDKKAPRDLRASAQGFLAFITMGVGGLVGSWLSGLVVEEYRTGETHNWRPIWLIAAASSAVIAFVFGLAFHDRPNGKQKSG